MTATPDTLGGSTMPLDDQIPMVDTAATLSHDDDANRRLRAFLTEPPSDAHELSGKRFAVLSTDGVEEIEITGPLTYLRARGATAHVIAPNADDFPALGLRYPERRNNSIITIRFMENSGWLPIDRALSEATVDDYDALIIPGGAWNPDVLRNTPAAIEFVKAFEAAGKIVAAICHGPQVLVTAGLLNGRRATGWWACHADIENAGATFQDTEVVVDGRIITSRYPLDIPAFVDAVVAAV